MSWNTEPICDDCWEAENGDRQAVRLRDPELLRCCMCGSLNMSGIFVRKHSDHVNYPNRGGVI